MTKLDSVTRAGDGTHKWKAVFTREDGRKKTTYFGASNMDDYTLTHDQEQRARYRDRHRKDLITNDPTRAGFLSWYLLWNKPTLKASIADFKRQFNL
jgi:hypothetical protein